MGALDGDARVVTGRFFARIIGNDSLQQKNKKNIMQIFGIDMGVSKNNGTPKWMVYNGKPS